jgi:purine-nucleoside phosphorylase
MIVPVRPKELESALKKRGREKAARNRGKAKTCLPGSAWSGLQPSRGPLAAFSRPARGPLAAFPRHTAAMSDLFDRLNIAAGVIAEKTGHDRHDAVVVLGSGLGSYPEGLVDAVSVPYAEIPGFPVPHVMGHSGRAFSAPFGPNRVLLLSGRAHTYEGHDMDTVVFAVRASIRAGCRTVVLTNAAGGCGDGLAAGDLVLIRDHINLAGRSPLVGINDDRLGPRFPDMSTVYTPRLRELALQVAAEVGVPLREGVYSWFLGPAFETPAEVQMAKLLGADLVGMSTAPEATAARHMGADVVGISLVTNLAAGISPTPLSHEEVTLAADEARGRFASLLSGLLDRL